RGVETARDPKDNTKGAAETVTEMAQNIGEKAKQTVQDAWGAAKETSQKIKEIVVGKTEETKDSTAERLEDAGKRSSNEKDC
ncbi:hypothetical protein INO08_15150, partial [Staphylococcus aureus]|nr:hypothetical protein [Staphylococcus aureus]